MYLFTWPSLFIGQVRVVPLPAKSWIMSEDTRGFLLLQTHTPSLYPKPLHSVLDNDKIIIALDILQFKNDTIIPVL
jgi:hypothetical protein